MSRYIDADALIQLGLQDGAYEYVSVQEIADFPTADVVEVVRCKECKRRDICRTTTTWAIPPTDDWFCADGERRKIHE